MSLADDLRNSHGNLPAVLRSRSSILITLDQDGLILLWNSGAEECFGLREEQVLGSLFVHCGIRWDWGRIERLVPGGISRQAKRIVQPFNRPDGRLSTVAMQVLPQFAPDGTLNGCLWLGSDTGHASARLTPGPVRSQVGTSSVHIPPPAPTRPVGEASTRSSLPATTSARTPGPLPATTSARTPGPLPAPTSTRTPLPLPTPLPGSHPTPLPGGASVEATHRFPVHLSFLDSHLVAQGDDLSQWRITTAVESRLDEGGMEVLFTLARPYPQAGQMTRRILIASGELIHVQDV